MSYRLANSLALDLCHNFSNKVVCTYKLLPNAVICVKSERTDKHHRAPILFSSSSQSQRIVYSLNQGHFTQFTLCTQNTSKNSVIEAMREESSMSSVSTPLLISIVTHQASHSHFSVSPSPKCFWCAEPSDDTSTSSLIPHNANPETLERVCNEFNDALRHMFSQNPRWSLFHRNLLLEDNIRGCRYVNFINFMIYLIAARLYFRLAYPLPKCNILKSSIHPEESCIKVRWQIECTFPQLRLPISQNKESYDFYAACC